MYVREMSAHSPSSILHGHTPASPDETDYLSRREQREPHWLLNHLPNWLRRINLRRTVSRIQKWPFILRCVLVICLPLYVGLLMMLFGIMNCHRSYLFVNRQDWLVLTLIGLSFQVALVLFLIMFTLDPLYSLLFPISVIGILVSSVCYSVMVVIYATKDSRRIRRRRRARENRQWNQPLLRSNELNSPQLPTSPAAWFANASLNTTTRDVNDLGGFRSHSSDTTLLQSSARHAFDETESLSAVKAELVQMQLLKHVECHSARILWSTFPVSLFLVFFSRLCLKKGEECSSWSMFLDEYHSKSLHFWIWNVISVALIFSELSSSVLSLVILHEHVALMQTMSNMKLWFKPDNQREARFSRTLASDLAAPTHDPGGVKWGTVAHGWNDLARPEHMLVYFHVFRGIMDELYAQPGATAMCTSSFFFHVANIVLLSITAVLVGLLSWVFQLDFLRSILTDFVPYFPIIFSLLLGLVLFTSFASQLEEAVGAQIKQIDAVQLEVQKQIDRQFNVDGFTDDPCSLPGVANLLGPQLRFNNGDSLVGLQVKVDALTALATYVRCQHKKPTLIGLSLSGVKWLTVFVLLGLLNFSLGLLNILICTIVLLNR